MVPLLFGKREAGALVEPPRAGQDIVRPQHQLRVTDAPGGRHAFGNQLPADPLPARRVLDMQPGQIRYGLVTNESGGILDDVLVYRLADAGLADAPAATASPWPEPSRAIR